MDESLTGAVESLIRREVDPDARLCSLERLYGGGSRETYRLGVGLPDGSYRSLALRRVAGRALDPRSGRGPATDIEVRLMHEARRAGVPGPRVVSILRPTDGLGAGFLMEWIEGETRGRRIAWSPAFAGARRKLAYQVGDALARIHRIDPDATGLRGLLRTWSPREAVLETWDRYQRCFTPQPMIDYTARWLLEHLPEARQPAIVHGDFRSGNLMVSPKHGLAAVLDWETSFLGNPMQDLGWLCMNSWRFGRSELPVGGFGTIPALVEGYNANATSVVNPDELLFWMVFGSFSWSVGCLIMAQRNGTDSEPDVERPAIGRRSSECQIDCVNLLIPGPVDPLAMPRSGSGQLDIPATDELLSSVRDFLRHEVLPASEGRLRFLARVASNSLDTVRREKWLGPTARNREREALERLLGRTGDVGELRWVLVRALRDGRIDLDCPGLAEYLRNSVAARVMIDQPKYSGLETALAISAAPKTRERLPDAALG